MLAHAEDILAALPHGYPFVMVDRVLELEPGRRAVALKNLSAGSCLSGPLGRAVSPEALVLESMAQTGALAYALSPAGSAGPSRPEGYLAALNDVEFLSRPRFGDTVELTLELSAAMGPMARFVGVARISGEVAVRAALTFTVQATGI